MSDSTNEKIDKSEIIDEIVLICHDNQSNANLSDSTNDMKRLSISGYTQDTLPRNLKASESKDSETKINDENVSKEKSNTKKKEHNGIPFKRTEKSVMPPLSSNKENIVEQYYRPRTVVPKIRNERSAMGPLSGNTENIVQQSIRPLTNASKIKNVNTVTKSCPQNSIRNTIRTTIKDGQNFKKNCPTSEPFNSIRKTILPKLEEEQKLRKMGPPVILPVRNTILPKLSEEHKLTKRCPLAIAPVRTTNRSTIMPQRTIPKSPNLSTKARVADREIFNVKLKEKEEKMRLAKESEDRAREEAQRKKDIEDRSKTVHKPERIIKYK